MVNIVLSGLAGLLLSFAFEPVGKWYFAPLAFVVHIYALNRTKKKARSVLAFSLVFNAFLLHWTSIYVGAMPWIILFIALSILYLPLTLVKRWGISSYPLLFVALEEVRNRFPFNGFGWGRVAYSQADAPYAQIARFGGSISLSAVTILISLFIYLLLQKTFKPFILLPLILIALPYNVDISNHTNILMIQGNVPQYGLDFNSRAKQVFSNHVKETDKALRLNRDIDFILWPENAVDVNPFRDEKIQTTLNSFGYPLVIGAIVDKNSQIFNTSILWTKEGQSVYAKQYLTPFGEYIPLRPLARKVSHLVDQVSDFSAGDESKVFTIEKTKFSPIICFELLNDALIEKSAKSGNLLAVQTNSATFGRSAESSQQLSISRIRAIEHTRNLVSVSTTGYSAVINYKGQVVQKTSMGTAESLYASVGLIDRQSPRDYLGGWASFLSLMWLLIVARRRS